MRQAERLLKVKEEFAKQEFLTFETLCEQFGASKSSIRRDLVELERMGILRRVHGGAISLQIRDEVMDFSRLSGSLHDEKIAIGRAASDLVENGQTVILGGGSTVVEVAHRLLSKSLQVVTNSIPVAQVFWDSKAIEVTLTGGYLYPRLGVQLGPICERMLHSVSADLLIMGIRGITAAGISDSNSLIVESLRAMIKAARQVVIVADHSKFGRDAMIHVAPLSDIDEIITDVGVAAEFRKMLEEHDVRCRIAN